jgi:hypothetical protein
VGYKIIRCSFGYQHNNNEHHNWTTTHTHTKKKYKFRQQHIYSLITVLQIHVHTYTYIYTYTNFMCYYWSYWTVLIKQKRWHYWIKTVLLNFIYQHHKVILFTWLIKCIFSDCNNLFISAIHVWEIKIYRYVEEIYTVDASMTIALRKKGVTTYIG